MGKHGKGSGGNSHQRAVRASLATGNPMYAQKVVNGAHPMRNMFAHTRWGFDRRITVGGIALTVILALAGIATPILWPEAKGLGWFLLFVAGIILCAWLSFEAVQLLGRNWRAYSAVLLVWVLVIGGEFLLYRKWGRTVETASVSSPSPKPDAPKGLPQAPPNPTTPTVYPRSRADADRIARQIGVAYQSQHPQAGREELQTAVNRELAREGYTFTIVLPHIAKNHPANPPSLFGVGDGYHLSFSGITIKGSGPNNGMTAIRTGNRSPVTMTGGGIEGFSNGIKTGNHSPVNLINAPITTPKPNAPTEQPPDKKPKATPQ